MIRRVSSVTSHTFAHIRGVFYAGGSECPARSMKEERINNLYHPAEAQVENEEAI